MSAGRPVVRTDSVNADISLAMRTLFTPKKAMDLLRLESEGISYKSLRRAMTGQTLIPSEVRIIEIAWSQWASKYLRDTEELDFIR